jgi:hypothetical protein
VNRLVLLCLVPLLLAFPAVADCLDDLKEQLARIELKLTAGAVPPEIPPTVPPVVPPTTPPAAGCSCQPGLSYTINGQGTLRGVCTPAVLTVRNTMPGASLIWVKQPIVVPGRVKMTEGGKPVGVDGYGPIYDLGMGDHTYQLTPDLPCTNLAIQVR